MKVIYALMGASLLVIVLGVYLISQTQQAAEQEIPPPNEPPAQRDIGVIPTVKEEERDSDIPQLEVDAERGSEQWCEQMMALADDKWSHEDSQTFADECIYE